MENVILGKDFNLGAIGSYFHAFTHCTTKINTICGIYTQHNEFSCISNKNKTFKLFYACVGFSTSYYDIKSNQLNYSLYLIFKQNPKNNKGILKLNLILFYFWNLITNS
jgi:hypothetical protein